VTRKLLSLVAAAALVGGLACRKPPAAAEASGQAAAAPQTPAAPVVPEPPKPVPAQLPDVLARVNGQPVTKTDFDRLIKNMEMSAGQPVPAERRDEIYRKALDQLITYAALSQEVKARSITVPDAEVDANLAEMKKQFPNEAEFQKALTARGMTPDKLRSDAKVDMAINKLMETAVANLPEATDAQVREFYDKNPDKFKQDEAVRASHILIPVDQKADAATKKTARDKAEALAKQAKGGQDFAKLARENSSDGSAANGGDLNFMSRGQTVANFDKALFSMEPGQISDVVETEFGFHIIKVTEKKAASTVPFEQVSPRIRDFLTEQNKQAKAQAFIEDLKKKSKVEVLI
jgi:peptidyl-prolyl cis-trans isomerase C